MEKTTDRFETPPASRRVGVHRANPIIGSKRVWFLFAFLVTVLLSTVGIIILQMQPDSVEYSQEIVAESSAPPAVESVLDPEATVAVLNGSETDQLALFVDEEITQNGWGVIVFSGDGEDRNVTTSAIFYAEKEHESAANALGAKLGGVKAYLGPEYVNFENQLTVFLGEDYQGPGFEEAINAAVAPIAEPQEAEEEYVDEFGDEFGEGFFEEELYDEFYGEFYEEDFFEGEYFEG